MLPFFCLLLSLLLSFVMVFIDVVVVLLLFLLCSYRSVLLLLCCYVVVVVVINMLSLTLQDYEWTEKEAGFGEESGSKVPKVQRWLPSN